MASIAFLTILRFILPESHLGALFENSLGILGVVLSLIHSLI
jgi:hypothetical protein